MKYASFIRPVAHRLPYISDVLRERDQFRSQNEALQVQLRAREDRLQHLERLELELGWPRGHFYSPLPSPEDVRRHEDRIFASSSPELPGIALDVEEQLRLLDQLKPHYQDVPFSPTPGDDHRYAYENDYFSYGEAVVLFCLMRHLRPRRIVEVGSGYSSALMLDTLDDTDDGSCRLTLIEPYPDRLKSLLRPGDDRRVQLLQERVQDLDLSQFDRLDAGDLLFVDSSHVSKVDSDVNHLLFAVLPRLKPGVFVHFHDVYYPFEYPKDWIYQGRAWNEAYLLRGFLQYNTTFRIRFFNSYLGQFHADRLADLPLFLRNPGSSIWLQRC